MKEFDNLVKVISQLREEWARDKIQKKLSKLLANTGLLILNYLSLAYLLDDHFLKGCIGEIYNISQNFNESTRNPFNRGSV